MKIAEFERSKAGGLRLRNFNYGDIGAGPAEEERGPHITGAIQQLMAEKKIKSAPTVVSVSGQQVFVRYTKLPPVEKDKIGEIVRYEAQQNVPIPIEELVWDYEVLSPDGSADLEIALVAIKSNLVEDLVAAVEKAKLQPDIVDVAPMALYNCVRYNYGDPEGCVLLADIGGRTTNLIFIEPGRLYSRSIPIGGNSITQAIAAEYEISYAEAEQKKKAQAFVGLGAFTEPENEDQARLSQIVRSTMNRLEGEVRRTINLYKTQQGGSAPTMILLSGATSSLSSLDQYFRDKYPNVEVDFFNPFKNIEIVNGLPREELASCALFYGEVVGLGLRQVADCQIEVNLIPPTALARRAKAARTPWFVGAAFAALLTAATWSYYSHELVGDSVEQVDEIKSFTETLSKHEGEIKVAQGKVKGVEGEIMQVESIAEANQFWLRFFSDLEGRVPRYVWITTFRPWEAKDEGVAVGGVQVPFATGGPGIQPPSPPPGGAPAPPTPGQAVPQNVVSEVYALEGKSVYDPANAVKDVQMPYGEVAEGFVNELKKSPWVEDAKYVDGVPPKEKDYEWTFKIKLTIRKPKEL